MLVAVLRMDQKKPGQEAINITQVRDDDSLGQGGSRGNGKKSGSGYTVFLRLDSNGSGN